MHHAHMFEDPVEGSIPQDAISHLQEFFKRNQRGISELVSCGKLPIKLSDLDEFYSTLNDTSDLDAILRGLKNLREVFQEVSRFDQPGLIYSFPDLDAAILWYGSRLEEFVSRFESSSVRRRRQRRN